MVESLIFINMIKLRLIPMHNLSNFENGIFGFLNIVEMDYLTFVWILCEGPVLERLIQIYFQLILL